MLAACQPQAMVEPSLSQNPEETAVPDIIKTPSPPPTETPSPTPQTLLGFEPFSPESPLCKPEPQNSHLSLTCDEQSLVIGQSPDRRRVEAILMREAPFQASAARLQVEVASLPAEDIIHDQNQFGLFFIDQAKLFHAVRVEGQQIILETWSIESGGVRTATRTEPVFLPLIKSGGQTNRFTWQCSDRYCEFLNDDQLAARVRLSQPIMIRGGGLFAASDWDQEFSELTFSRFSVEVLTDDRLPVQVFSYQDDLTYDRGLFTQSGLSGAYNNFSNQGFHFSPLIPFETYAVQGGPAMADFSVSAKLRINMDPGRKASKFAGIMCRSSADGAYAAVLRADGDYFVYRSTPDSPFGLLAKGTYSDIKQPGLANIALRLECAGHQIDFYINDTLMNSVINKTNALGFGRAGLFAKAGGDPNPDEFIYHDLLIQEIISEQD